MADKESQERLKVLREEKNIVNEILNLLKKQESRRTDLTQSQTDANDIQKEFNALIRESKKIEGDIVNDLNATNKIKALINRANKEAKTITDKIADNVNGEGEAYRAVQESSENITAELEDQLKLAKSLDKSGNYFAGFAKIVDKVPVLSALKEPFQEAAKAARESAAEQAKGDKGISRSKASLAGMKKLMVGPAGLIGIFGFLGKLITDIDKRSTAFAKSLGISKDNARAVSKEFLNLQKGQTNLLIDQNNLVDATSQLSDNLGAVAVQSANTLRNQIFLSKNLGISAENASSLSFLFDTFNKSSKGATNSVIELNKNLGGTNGFLIPTNKLLNEIASTSAEIQGYFGFSAKELANAVYQTRRFGISLSTANSIASSLLDFETSLSNELQLELLTNRSLNFERARALAFTGDIAGASAEVLKQTQNLTEAQRRNPIILKAAAAAAGLSVEELNKSFTIQKRLNLSSKAYNDLVAKGSRLVGFERTQALMLQSASREEFENNLSIQQKFQAATTKITQQFEKLIDTGLIDKLIDGTVRFVTALTDGKGLLGAFRAFGTSGSSSSPSSVDAEDFTIRTHPKDTLVMSGGTKLGNETNVLLKELITAVKTGGDVYIDGAKVGSSLVMAKTKLS